MKKSSTKHAPNGRTPPMTTVKVVLRYQGAVGTSLGMFENLAGNSRGSLRKPKYAPRKTKGTEMPNQRARRASSVVIGTAPVEPS